MHTLARLGVDKADYVQVTPVPLQSYVVMVINWVGNVLQPFFVAQLLNECHDL